MYKIIQSPSEILRMPAKPVNPTDPNLPKIISEMTETLLAQKDPEGVGLAANQVSLPLKLFLTRFDPKKKSPVLVFLNPEIIAHSEELQPTEKDKKPQLEGCLSKPNYYGVVKRWQWIKIKFTPNIPNPPNPPNSVEEVFEGFPATVIQHEMDHLEGKIFVERIIEQKGKLYKITGKDKKGKDVWEEVEI